MRIAAANVQKFHYRSNVVPDSEGHGHPGPEQDAVQSLLTHVVALEGDRAGA
jgi:hypothetical protein